jgi:hypothetical protein
MILQEMLQHSSKLIQTEVPMLETNYL